jgi:hypothetical protein
MKNLFSTVVAVFCLIALWAFYKVFEQQVVKYQLASDTSKDILITRLLMLGLWIITTIFTLIMVLYIKWQEYKSKKELRDLKNELDLNSFETTLGQAE